MVERVACPCCGYRTLPEGPGAYELCPVCLWEDDGLPPWTCDGPNGISLVEAQQRFLARGKVLRLLRRDSGREPTAEEARDPRWRPLDVTEELLEKVAQARDEADREDEQQQGIAAFLQDDDPLEEFNAQAQELRLQAVSLSYPEVLERYGALCAAHGLRFPEAELELLAHHVKDEHWRVRHPWQAVRWCWRHRGSAPLRVRIRQLWTGAVRFAG